MNRLRAILRHLLVWWLPLPIALVVLLCAFALWLTGTQPGTRMLLGAVAQQFDGRAEHVRGSILGGLQVGRLQLALPGAEVEDYVKAVRKADLAEAGDDDVFRKLRSDFDAKGVSLSDEDLRDKMSEFLAQAVAQLEAAKH